MAYLYLMSQCERDSRRVVVHLLEGCVKAGREGKRARQPVGVQTPRRWMDGWMDGSKILIATVDAMNGAT